MVPSSILKLVVLSLGALSVAAKAGETIGYSYDVHGRLTAVTHSGSVNNGVSTTYTLDNADNRANLIVAGGAAALAATSDPVHPPRLTLAAPEAAGPEHEGADGGPAPAVREAEEPALRGHRDAERSSAVGQGKVALSSRGPDSILGRSPASAGRPAPGSR